MNGTYGTPLVAMLSGQHTCAHNACSSSVFGCLLSLSLSLSLSLPEDQELFTNEAVRLIKEHGGAEQTQVKFFALWHYFFCIIFKYSPTVLFFCFRVFTRGSTFTSPTKTCTRQPNLQLSSAASSPCMRRAKQWMSTTRTRS